MKIKHILTALGIFSGVAFSTSYAQFSNSNNYTTTAVPFLRIAPDARAAGMGEVGIATSPDANAGFWNLAKTPFAKSKAALGGTYSPWLKEINGEMFLASLAGYYQLANQQAVSGSLRYFNMGSFEQADYTGTVQQTSQPREFAVDLGYSRALSNRVAVGLAMRYIHSRLMDGSLNGTAYSAGSAVAADLSLFYNGTDEKGQGWNWGTTLSNLGSRMSYSNSTDQKAFLPARLGIGTAYTAVFNEDNKLTLAVDMNKLLVPSVSRDSTEAARYHSEGVVSSWVKSFNDYKRLQFSAGAEYTFMDQFSLRTGYYVETKQEGGKQYFTAGAGVGYQGFNLNFSYLVPFNDDYGRNPLSNTLRFGLLYSINQ